MRWTYPLDPECPEYAEFARVLLDDPMSVGAPTDDIMAAFERRHRAACSRCQEYAAANVAVA